MTGIVVDRLNTALAGHYRIERELGSGGMATVYLAQDLKHDRKVAIKVLKPELAAVLGAERFVQEIKTTAALQHPHILPLFDSGTADGFLYYVMPYIQGETIREKLNRETQFGVDEAIRIAREVAEALDYAHRHGVIHRDIKPENILLHEGRAMVMDFGIALAVSAAAGGRMTETGLSLGTPHYMSPEQATAEKELTPRSDVYSLASVLYEMLAGEPPHSGGSAQAVIMKIIAEAAQPVSQLRKNVPANVAAAVARALEKLPADRFDSAKAFADALENPAFTVSGSLTASRAGGTVGGGRWLVAVLATTTVALAAVAVWALLRDRVAIAAAPIRFTIPVPSGVVLDAGEGSNLAISPNGRVIVYLTTGRLWRRSLDADSSEAIPGTEGATRPFISVDGQWLGFSQRGELRRMPLAGGASLPVARLDAFFGAVALADGPIVYARRGGLSRIPASGGEGVPITTVGAGEAEHVWPAAIPGRNAILFTVLGNTGQWSDARLEALDLTSGKRTVVRNQGSHGRYLSSGQVVFVDASGTLSAIPFDARSLVPTGEPFPVESGIRTGLWATGAAFDVGGGTLVFARGSERQNDVLWAVTRDGPARQLGEPVTLWGLDLARDGRRAAALLPTPTTMEVWLLDIAAGSRERLTFGKPTEGMYESPRWSPDGQRVAFAFASGDSMRIAAVKVDGSAAMEPLRTRRYHQHVDDWARDGHWMLVDVATPDRGFDIQAIRLDGRENDVDLATTRAEETAARFSPDGRWVAYQSDESGTMEVYVVSFPEPRTRRQVSVKGGSGPIWSQRSDELFFWQDTTMMVTRVSTAGDFQRTTPIPVFARGVSGYTGATVDGRLFVLGSVNPAAPARELNVVVGWDAVVRAKGTR